MFNYNLNTMKNYLKILNCLFIVAILLGMYSCGMSPEVTWISTTDMDRWVENETPELQDQAVSGAINININKTAQVVDGFGGCFNELGWEALEDSKGHHLMI
jgi:glucosylceramidase